MPELIDNRYEILKKLGRGGTGEVYHVYDKVRNRELALKLLLPSQTEENLLHLKREFLVMTKLNHPNIVEVYDFVLNKENNSYFTMEYVAGDDFVKATGSLSIQKTGGKEDKYSNLYSLIIQICRTLEFIHSRGLVHCDIKPSNIIITKNKTAKLLDFGMTEPVDISTHKGMKGTIEYMSPEMIKGNQTDLRTDLYSLGVLFYEAVTHRLPFEGETPLSVLKQHLEKTPVSLSEYAKDIPEKLNQIILKLLSKYPYNRYQSAREVISDISLLAGEKEPLRDKGRDEPQKGWLLNGCFVDREKEIVRLNDLLAKGKGVVVSISGDAGIGKTRLMEEFRIQAQLKGRGFWKSICRQEEKMVYGPIVEILNGLIRAIESSHINLIEEYKEMLARFIPELRKKLSLPVFSKVTYEKIQFFDSVVQFLIKASHIEPYVLFIDNIEQASEETIEFFHYLIKNIEKSNIILCFAFCEEKTDKKNILVDKAENINLKGLNQNETDTLITSMLGGHKLASSPMQKIFKETQGNPLFIQELLKSMSGKTLLFQKGKWIIEEVDFEKLKLSKTIKETFKEHLKTLNSGTYETLKICSVFSKKFELNIIKEIINCPEEELLDAVNELLQKDFLIEHTDGYYFVSLQLREMLYEELKEENRKKFHQAIGEIIEKRFADKLDLVVEELSYHFARGINKEKAFNFSLKAGQKAKSLYAYKEAIKYFKQALGVVEGRKNTDYRLSKEFGDIYILEGNYDEAINKYKEVLTGNPEEVADIYCDIGVGYRKKGESDAAIQSYEKAISSLQDKGNQKVKARIYQEMSWTYQTKADYDKALDCANKGLIIAEQYGDLQETERIYHNMGTIYLRKSKLEESAEYFKKSLEIKRKVKDLQGEAASNNNLGVVYSTTGDFNKAFQHYKEALDISEKIKNPIGMARGYKNIGTIYYRQGNLTKAQEHYSKAFEIEERMGDDISLAASYNNIGLIYIQQKKWQEAIDFFTRSLKIKEKIGDIQGIAGCYNNLGSVYNSQNNWDEASKCYQKSLSLKEKIKDYLGAANSLINLGTIHINQNKPGEAFNYLERAKAIGNELGNKRVLLGVYQALGQLYLNKKDIEESIKYNSDALDFAVALGSKAEQGIIYRKLFETYQLKKDNVKSEEYLLKSIKTLEEIDIEVELAKSYFKMGELKRTTGETKDGVSYLEKAKEIFEKLGMEENLKEIKNLLKGPVSKDLIGIYQVSSIINSILDIKQLLNKIMDIAIETLDAERGVLILTGEEAGDLRIEAFRGVEKNDIEGTTLISESIVRDVALKGTPLIVNDAGSDIRFRDKKSITNYHITSVLCVPLKIKERTIGAIYLDHRRVTDLFASEDISFLTTFSNLAAVAIENARLHMELQKENIYLKQEAEEKYQFEKIVGKSKEMRKLYKLMEKVIDNSTSVLLDGETGTGKEVIARTIHYSGPRKDKKFIPVDCASIPNTLFESELFGYLKGAFTGATGDKKGLFIEADEGTIFLDEVSNIPLELQSKLLRVLQEGEIRRLGEEKQRKIDVRIIAATNKDLKKETEAGRFRSDLYYRLNVIRIVIPPLRKRKEDIPLLVHHFLDKYSEKLGRKIEGITENAMRILLDYDWHGNVRELEHQIERAVTLSTENRISEDLFSIGRGKASPFIELREGTLKSVTEDIEKQMIIKALQKHKQKKDAAKALGLSRFGLQKKVERYKIE
ncbi:MAG: sigma 54-interacting transcriptional regulator [bacterium]